MKAGTRVPERLKMAKDQGKAEVIDFSKDTVYDKLMDMTKGRGPDSCIDAVGCRACYVVTVAPPARNRRPSTIRHTPP